MSTTICESFVCTEFDTGDGEVSYLNADMRVECGSGEHASVTSYAWLMLVLLPLGVPLAMHAILYSNRDAIEQRNTRTGDEELEHLAVWFAPYKRDKWW